MDDELGRVAGAMVGELATVRPDGRPHLVPMVFALVGRDVVTAIDWKPKGKRRLQRLVNIENDPRVSFLVHHYEDHWERLWWVRVDGTATIHHSNDRWEQAIAALVEKYAQYRDRPPEGDVIWIATEVISSWESRR
ncbi:MAG: TIGR03668 family PPOX class F420-dependent oxidoreductase [Actinobacteria bacterium]|nr:TIGR03668 family PPOX class F420-dependent oxidoreductase [Actinomycetota bacterium]MCI0543595.1 TIGR03668 family PPOX class F420-dependent oxidoreductase [Actinomycetota bacterium]MCI0679137.1 TIGR03668 family PPOX class F420-dependent oxidoreductase [Actinomycetota bacterium]